MKLIIVGVREGKPVIHWPGVIVASAMMVTLVTIGALLMCLALDRSFALLPQTLSISIPLVLLTVVGVGIKRGLQTPPDQLPPV